MLKNIEDIDFFPLKFSNIVQNIGFSIWTIQKLFNRWTKH